MINIRFIEGFFNIGGQEYILHIEYSWRRQKIELYAKEKPNKKRQLIGLKSIPIKIEASSLQEEIAYWIVGLMKKMIKKNCKKLRQSGCGSCRKRIFCKVTKELANRITFLLVGERMIL